MPPGTASSDGWGHRRQEADVDANAILDDSLEGGLADSGSATPSEPMSPLQLRRAKFNTIPLRIAVSAPGTKDAVGFDPELRNAEGALFGDLYEELDVLGRGSFCIVRRGVRRPDGGEIAIKTMQSNDDELRQLPLREYKILRTLEHPHIVRVHDLFSAEDRVVLVFDYFPGLCLSVALSEEENERFVEPVARPLFMALMVGLSYLHGRGIVHRDIKDNNVMVARSSLDLRIIDFNSACVLGDRGATPLSPLVGTSLWAEPEVLSSNASASKSGDVWAAGLCLHMMLIGCLPAAHLCLETREALARALSNLQLTFAEKGWEQVSEPCRMVLRRCLVASGELRPSASEVLEDTWLCNGG